MRKLLLVSCALLAAAVAAFAADVTGTWSGTLTGTAPDGTARNDEIMAILKQTDGKVTGTLGPNANQQMPIAEATLKENKLIIKFSQGPRALTLDLTMDGDRMTGTALSSSGTTSSPDRTAKVELAKAK